MKIVEWTENSITLLPGIGTSVLLVLGIVIVIIMVLVILIATITVRKILKNHKRIKQFKNR